MATTSLPFAKNCLFFKLGSLRALQGLDAAEHLKSLASALTFLKKLESDGKVTLYLVAGQEKEKAQEKIDALGLGKFFSPENLFFVTRGYIDSKQEIDRERHLSALEKDKDFTDEYFTQFTISGLVASGKVEREKAILIGSDIWFDGFYTSRFSGVDFVFVSQNLAERNVPVQEKPTWLNYISLSKEDMEKILAADLPKNDPHLLQKHIMDKLAAELLKETDFSKLAAKAAKKRFENN